MRARSVLAPALFALLAAAPSARAAGTGDASGPWQTEDGSAVVRIAACGPALCGTIIWAEKPLDAKGQPLCGRAILGDIVETGAGSWGKGWIYSPKTGSQYPVTLTLAADGKLKLHISAGLFGKDQTWTRPSQTVAACTP